MIDFQEGLLIAVKLLLIHLFGHGDLRQHHCFFVDYEYFFVTPLIPSGVVLSTPSNHLFFFPKPRPLPIIIACFYLIFSSSSSSSSHTTTPENENKIKRTQKNRERTCGFLLDLVNCDILTLSLSFSLTRHSTALIVW